MNTGVEIFAKPGAGTAALARRRVVRKRRVARTCAVARRICHHARVCSVRRVARSLPWSNDRAAWICAAALFAGCSAPTVPGEPQPSLPAPVAPRDEALRASAPVPTEDGPVEASARPFAHVRAPGAPPKLVVQGSAGSYVGRGGGLLSADGKVLGSYEEHGGFILWDATTAREIRRWEPDALPFGPVFHFADDGRTVVGRSSDDKSVIAWDLVADAPKWQWIGYATKSDPSTHRMVVCGAECAIIDGQSGAKVATLEGAPDWRYVFSSDGKRVLGVSWSADTLAIFDADSGQLIERRGDKRDYSGAAFSDDFQLAAFALADGFVSIIDLQKKSVIKRRVVDFSPELSGVTRIDDQRVEGTVSDHASVRPYELDWRTGAVRLGKVRSRFSDEFEPGSRGPAFNKYDNGTHAVLRVADGTERPLSGPTAVPGRILGSATHRLHVDLHADNAVPRHLGSRMRGVVVDVSTGETLRVIEAPAVAAGLSPDGTWLLLQDGSLAPAAGDGPTIQLEGTGLAVGLDRSWVLTTNGMYHHNGEKLDLVPSPVPGGDPDTNYGAASADGRWVFSARVERELPTVDQASQTGEIAVWDGTSGAVQWVAKTDDGKRHEFHLSSAMRSRHGDSISNVAVDARGARLVIASRYAGQGFVIDMKSGKSMLAASCGGFAESVALDPGGRLLLACGGPTRDKRVLLFDAKGAELATFTHDAPVSSAVFLPETDFVLSSSLDRTLRIWDVASKREAIRMMVWPDGRWLAVDPSGRFDTNRIEKLEGVHWTAPGEPYTTLPLEAFMRDYYQPGLVARVLARSPLDPVPDLNRLNTLQPEVRIASATVAPDGTLTVEVLVRDRVARAADGSIERSSGPRDLRLFRDGRLVGRQPAELGTSSKTTFSKIPIPSGKKEVELGAYAFNEAGVKSETVALRIPVPERAPASRPRAYLVHAGVDRYAASELDLSFAVADADALATRLATGLAATYDVRSARLFARASATHGGGRNELVAVLRQLADGTGDRRLLENVDGASGLEPAGPDDLVVFTFSGHGVSSDSGRFNLLFSDYGGGSPDQRPPGALSDIDLAREVQPIDAAELVVVIDACQSALAVDAGGFKPGPLGSRGLGQMVYDKKMRLLAASQSNEVAFESASIGHGLLTYALGIEGIDQGQADHAPKDGAITLGEWLRYGATRVPALADALVTGDGASRGVTRVRIRPQPRPVMQQPRLYDYIGHESGAIVGRVGQ